MGDRCEKCERAVTEMRAEFDQLRKDLVRRIEVIFDKTQEDIDEVETRSSDLVTDIGNRQTDSVLDAGAGLFGRRPTIHGSAAS